MGIDRRVEFGALALYLREIQKIPVLGPAEGVSSDSESCRATARLDELVRRNLRFVVIVARPYARHGVPSKISSTRATSASSVPRNVLTSSEASGSSPTRCGGSASRSSSSSPRRAASSACR